MDNPKRYVKTCAILLLVCVLVLTSVTAFGARAAGRLPAPPKIKASQPWMAVVYSVVALAGICVIAFKDPKRSHSA
ncbi:MAG: hypothetical protein GY794_11935 [bacterium]|nr:hypothetical protein [bacterium]